MLCWERNIELQGKKQRDLLGKTIEMPTVHVHLYLTMLGSQITKQEYSSTQ